MRCQRSRRDGGALYWIAVLVRHAPRDRAGTRQREVDPLDDVTTADSDFRARVRQATLSEFHRGVSRLARDQCVRVRKQPTGLVTAIGARRPAARLTSERSGQLNLGLAKWPAVGP